VKPVSLNFNQSLISKAFKGTYQLFFSNMPSSKIKEQSIEQALVIHVQGNILSEKKLFLKTGKDLLFYISSFLKRKTQKYGLKSDSV
jgi:hypothetical protein